MAHQKFKAQAVASRTFTVAKAFERIVHLKKLWHIRVTTDDHIYPGLIHLFYNSKTGKTDRAWLAEQAAGKEAVDSTQGIVLRQIRNDRFAPTFYYACRPGGSVEDKRSHVIDARAHPAGLRCRNGGHGRGLSQEAANYLARRGFDTGKPTEGADYPSNFRRPWTYSEILAYYYDDVRQSYLNEVDAVAIHETVAE